jgi:sugar/nucleoside kinase (ribokinase family)
VFLNRQEATFYSARPALADALDFWRAHARHVIVKQGEEGALWIGEHGDEHSPARRVRVVDRTGAGDAFNGAFLYGFLRGLSRPECLRLGNVVAGRCIGKVGAVNGLPRSDEVRLAAGTGR